MLIAWILFVVVLLAVVMLAVSTICLPEARDRLAVESRHHLRSWRNRAGHYCGDFGQWLLSLENESAHGRSSASEEQRATPAAAAHEGEFSQTCSATEHAERKLAWVESYESASVIRDGQSLPVFLHMELSAGDVIETLSDGHLLACFIDGSRVAVGSRTMLRLFSVSVSCCSSTSPTSPASPSSSGGRSSSEACVSGMRIVLEVGHIAVTAGDCARDGNLIVASNLGCACVWTGATLGACVDSIGHAHVFFLLNYTLCELRQQRRRASSDDLECRCIVENPLGQVELATAYEYCNVGVSKRNSLRAKSSDRERVGALFAAELGRLAEYERIEQGGANAHSRSGQLASILDD